jgi:alkylated DNA repair dioxygenase AlkB
MTAPVTYIHDFLQPHYAKGFYEDLWNELDWERREFAPRREYWVNSLNQPYTYGQGVGVRTYYPRPDHFAIATVRLALMHKLGFTYEGCFLNGYEGERDALGWHSDDDPGINHSRPIAVVTLGAGREIQFMDKATGERGAQLLEPGSLLLMHPGMQSTHLHRIPKVGHKVEPRISLTFRSLING